MARFYWADAIDKHFGGKAFYAEELAKKTGAPLNRVRKALWHAVKKTKAVKHNEDDTYQLKNPSQTEKKPVPKKATVLKKKKIFRQVEILHLLSKKFGDDEFRADDLIKMLKTNILTARSQVQRMFESKLLRRVERGTYAISNKGHDKIASCFGVEDPVQEEPIEVQPKDTLLKQAVPKDTNGLLTTLQGIKSREEMEDWATRTIMDNGNWEEMKTKLIGRAALNDLECRELLEEKAKEMLNELMNVGSD